MGVIPGERKPELRRNQFHAKDGTHLYPHPNTYEPRRSLWSAAERRYAAHLDRHAELATNPERMEGDHPAVTALFDHIDHLLLIVEKERKLILGLREKAAAGAEPDEKDVKAIRMITRGGVEA
jgi:hypothetical protein